ncbi:MAG: hypothetical protein OXE78_00120, partial [Gammaproteobacteria bacterium]|nr:hypothetical protein [Gammaproteobacteria bacterium]
AMASAWLFSMPVFCKLFEAVSVSNAVFNDVSSNFKSRFYPKSINHSVRYTFCPSVALAIALLTQPSNVLNTSRQYYIMPLTLVNLHDDCQVMESFCQQATASEFSCIGNTSDLNLSL